MLPYIIVAGTIKTIGLLTNKILEEYSHYKDMMHEIKNSFYINSNAIEHALTYSLLSVVIIGSVLFGILLAIGVLFGGLPVIALLIGFVISNLQLSYSNLNSGIAWENASDSVQLQGVPYTESEILNYQKSDLQEKLSDLQRKDPDSKDDSIQHQVVNLKKEIERISKAFEDNKSKQEIAHPLNYDQYDETQIAKNYRFTLQSTLHGKMVGEPFQKANFNALISWLKSFVIFAIVCAKLFTVTSYLNK